MCVWRVTRINSIKVNVAPIDCVDLLLLVRLGRETHLLLRMHSHELRRIYNALQTASYLWGVVDVLLVLRLRVEASLAMLRAQRLTLSTSRVVLLLAGLVLVPEISSRTSRAACESLLLVISIFLLVSSLFVRTLNLFNSNFIVLDFHVADQMLHQLIPLIRLLLVLRTDSALIIGWVACSPRGVRHWTHLVQVNVVLNLNWDWVLQRFQLDVLLRLRRNLLRVLPSLVYRGTCRFDGRAWKLSCILARS